MTSEEEYAENAIREYYKRLEHIRSNSILSPVYRRKKILLWVLRTLIVSVIYILLWKYSWIRWTLWITVPICVLNIVSIFTWKYLLQQKINKNKIELAEMEAALKKKREQVPQNQKLL
jgi:hypothetical protein